MSGADLEFLEQLDPDINYFDPLLGDIIEPHFSEYVSVEDYNESLNGCDMLSVICYNVRSFHKNADAFLGIFSSKSPDIVILTETWFSNYCIKDIAGYTGFHTAREGMRSGGVSVFVKCGIAARCVADKSYADENIEICTVEVSLRNVNLIVYGIYRPHQAIRNKKKLGVQKSGRKGGLCKSVSRKLPKSMYQHYCRKNQYWCSSLVTRIILVKQMRRYTGVVLILRGLGLYYSYVFLTSASHSDLEYLLKNC